MPAKSKSQQAFMGMVHAAKKGELKNPSKAVKKAAEGMSDKAAKDFASTKTKNLPKHVKESFEQKLDRLLEDILPGGKGDDKPDSQFDPEQLAMGIKVESEHTPNKALAKEIAKDHLSEDPQYYTKLKTVHND